MSSSRSTALAPERDAPVDTAADHGNRDTLGQQRQPRPLQPSSCLASGVTPLNSPRRSSKDLDAKDEQSFTADTRRLVADISYALGLSVTHLNIRIDEHAARETKNHGAHGLLKDATVLLHPGHFQPRTFRGRYLLAHELTHVAQLRSMRTRHGVERGTAPAEKEARHIGTLLAEQRLPSPPRYVLPDQAVVADVGEATATTESDARSPEQELDALVGTQYHTEIARIKQLLRGIWHFLWFSNAGGSVEEVLLILQSVDFALKRSLVRALTRVERETLVDNISGGHFRRFRVEILAAYSMLEGELIQQQDEHLFDGMDFTGLRDEEYRAVLHVKAFLPPEAWSRLREDPQQGEAVREIDRLDASRLGGADMDRLNQEARQSLQQRVAESRAAASAVAGDEELGHLLEQIRQKLHDSPSDQDRLDILDDLTPYLREPEKLRGVAEALQPPRERRQEDLLERLFQHFPVTALYQPSSDQRVPADTRLTVFIRLASYRPPWRNVRLAQQLLDTGLFDWIVNDEEAYLAFQLIRAVPEAVRNSFLAEHGETIDANVSQSMRESARWNFYNGGEGRLDQVNIQAQLLEEDLWTREGMAQLEGLIRMAIAAGEHRFVFEQSRLFYRSNQNDYTSAEFIQRIVEPYQLFNPDAVDEDNNPDPRVEYQPEYLQSVPWYQEGVFSYFDSYVVQGLDFIFSSENVDILTNSIGGSGLNAAEFQDMFGGSFLGIRFQRLEELGEEGANAREQRQGVNFIDRVRWDQREGVIEMTASNLAIAAIRYPVDSLLFQAGEGRLNGLQVRITYPTQANRQNTSLDLSIEQLTLSDLLIIFSDSMWGINTLEIRGLRVDLGSEAIEDEQQRAREGENAGAWVFAFLLPGILHLGRVLSIIPSSSQLRSGLLEPNNPAALLVRWDSINAQGITSSGGRFIEEVSLEDFQLGLAGSRAGYIQLLQESERTLSRRREELSEELSTSMHESARTALMARINRVEAQRNSISRLHRRIISSQNELAELHARQQRDPQSLDTSDRERMASLDSFLRTFDRGGMTLDSGRITIHGLRGNAELEELVLTDIHGTGTSGGGILAALTESDALTRIIEGDDYRPATVPSLQREEADFTLDIGDFELNNLRILSGIPSPEEAQEDLNAAQARLLERNWDLTLREEVERLERRLQRTRRYHRLAQMGVTQLTAEERQTLRFLRRELSREEAFYAARLRVEGAELSLGNEGRDVNLRAQRLDAERPVDDEGNTLANEPGIRMRGMTIGEIHGTDIQAGIELEGGLLSVLRNPSGSGSPNDDLRRRVTELGLSGSSLEVIDIRRPEEQLTIERVTLEEFGLNVRPQDGEIEAHAQQGEIVGMRRALTKAYLEREIRNLEAMGAERRSSTENERLTELREALETYEGFVEIIRQQMSQYLAAEGEQETARSREELMAILAMFQQWRQQLGAVSAEVQDLGVHISGTGPVLDPGYSIDDALQQGVIIRGTGTGEAETPQGQREQREDRIFRSLELTDTRFGDMAAQRIGAGQTFGSVQYGRSHIGLDNMYIEQLSLTDFLLTAHSSAEAEQGGGSIVQQVWSHGTSTARGITVSVDLRFIPSDEDHEEYRLHQVQLQQLNIRELQGQNLGYASTHNPPDPLQPDPNGNYQTREFELASGTLHGIWATGIVITMPANDGEEMRITGLAGLQALTEARLNTYVEDAINYGHARLNGEHLQIEFLENNEQIIDIGRPIYNEDGELVGHEGGLTLSEGDARADAGRARFSARRLRGRIRRQGDIYRLQNVRLQQATLQRFHWRSGDKRFRAMAPAVFNGILVDATVDLSEPDNAQVQIDHIHIASIVAQDFEYVQPPLTVHIRQDADLMREAEQNSESPPAPLEIVDADIRNLQWSTRGGLGTGTRPGEGRVEVQQVHSAFDLLRNDMGLDAVADAEDISLRFRRDGSQVLNINELDATAHGTAADGVNIDISVEDLTTGDVTISNDRIEVPNLRVPRIDIDHLSVSTESLDLNIPHSGARISLLRSHINAIIERDPKNDAQPVRRIILQELRVEETQVRGLRLVLRNQEIAGVERDVTITTNAAVPLTIEELRLGARNESGEGFIIEPNASSESWRLDGLTHFDRIHGERLAVEVENLLKMTTNFDATNIDAGLDFDLERISDGQWTLDIDHLDLDELTGNAGEHHFNISTGSSQGSNRVDQPSLRLQGIHRREDGSMRLDEATLRGFVYQNRAWGLRVDVQEVSLPEGVEAPSGDKVVLPRLIIEDAQFSVDDILGIGGGTAGTSTRPNYDFLDAMDGSISIEAEIPYFFNDVINIRINNGVVDIDDVEDEVALEGFIDFDIDGSNLLLNLDWAMVTSPGFLSGANTTLARFENLTPAEIERLEEHETAMLSTLLETYANSGGTAGPPDPNPTVGISNITGDFTLHQTRVDLGTHGEILLGGEGENGIVGITINGAIPSQLRIGVERINAHLNPDNPLRFGGVEIGAGSLVIQDITDTSLTFTGYTPGRLEGTIRRAEATNFRINLGGGE